MEQGQLAASPGVAEWVPSPAPEESAASMGAKEWVLLPLAAKELVASLLAAEELPPQEGHQVILEVLRS